MKHSAGLLMYRRRAGVLEVFLVHPGGPFFRTRDFGAWSIPKGEYEPGENPLDVAKREFREETGQDVEQCRTSGGFLPLGEVKQRSGKNVVAWAFEGDWPAGAELHSNPFTIEWPPHSGREASFPEVDRGAFFGIDEASRRLMPAHVEFVTRLIGQIGAP